MQYRNAAYNAHGTIDVEVEHPVYGWIPFTASPLDPEQHGRDIYEAALSGGVAPYVPPAPEPSTIPSRVSPAQAEIALYRYDDGVLLGQVNALIASYPYEPVRIWWRKATYIERDHTYLQAVAVELGLSEETVDALFIVAGGIT